MEPSFIATPYVQASSPASRQIRAWLDEREESYSRWRASRKPVKHAFASAKLNSPVRAAPLASTAQAKTPSVPLWLTLSNNQTAEANTAALGATKKKPETPGVVDPLASALSPTSRRASLRRSSVSTSALPSLTKSDVPHQRISSSKSVRTLDSAAFPHLATAASATATTTTATTTRSPGVRVRTSALAKKRLKEHLYDFHSSQVFSFAQCDDEHEPADTPTELSDSTTDSKATPDTNDSVAPVDALHATTANSNNGVISTPTALPTETHRANCLLDGVAFMAPHDYARIFEHDWGLSDVERVVRDAVERQRIYVVLQSAYRELLWFFRFYAGKTALASGAVHDLFQVPNRLQVLEALNVPCVDPPRFGLTDAPLRRDGLVGFLLSVAKMMSAHSASPARVRVLLAEGIELSDAMKMLVRDHFRVYAQLQDANHFRFVFLQKPRVANGSACYARGLSTGPGGGSAGKLRRLQDVLLKHKVNLASFFRESVKAPMPLAGGPEPSMTFVQFLSALKALGLIARPNAKAAPTASSTSASSVSTAASGPSVIEEGRALRVFLSCLAMRASDCIERDTGISTRTLTLEQFVEALLRIALMRKELAVCSGGYDVCPGELTSELCACEPERMEYDFRAFDDAVDELFAAIHVFRLQQAHKRSSGKLHSLLSLHTKTSQQSGLRTQHRLAVSMHRDVDTNGDDDDNTES